MIKLHLRDDQAHLKTPVAEMDIADDVVAEEPVNALDGLADDGASEVADMKRLCNVRPAVVHDDGPGILLGLDAEVRSEIHFRNVLREKAIRQLKVQKAGVHGLDAFKHRIAV